ncbi:DUF2808 domain-containing protein [Nostoc sp. FACHB-973]|nr:DUF2808 domain-containing protein [Nostoc sp. FACHB-973]
MKKLLIFTAALTLSITTLATPSYATARTDNDKIPHIDGNVQFPPTRWQIVRHTFRLHIPENSKAVTQLLIQVPDNVTISNNINNIDIVDGNGQKINANISINGKTILLAFTEPVAANTKLEINLNKIKRRNAGNGSVYSFSAREVGIDAIIPIGVSWFRTY